MVSRDDSILLPALASAVFALLHFYFGLTLGVLSESQANGLAIGIVLGLIFSLWIGAMLGWLGYLVGRTIGARRDSPAG
jgi:hypothetical protein